MTLLPIAALILFSLALALGGILAYQIQTFTPNDLAMPATFEALARYNAERSRGIVHTTATDNAMARIQVEFDEWARDE
jgi:hypothetical protein